MDKVPLYTINLVEPIFDVLTRQFVISPSENRIAILEFAGTVNVYDIPTRSHVASLEIHASYVPQLRNNSQIFFLDDNRISSHVISIIVMVMTIHG